MTKKKRTSKLLAKHNKALENKKVQTKIKKLIKQAKAMDLPNTTNVK